MTIADKLIKLKAQRDKVKGPNPIVPPALAPISKPIALKVMGTTDKQRRTSQVAANALHQTYLSNMMDLYKREVAAGLEGLCDQISQLVEKSILHVGKAIVEVGTQAAPGPHLSGLLVMCARYGLHRLYCTLSSFNEHLEKLLKKAELRLLNAAISKANLKRTRNAVVSSLQNAGDEKRGMTIAGLVEFQVGKSLPRDQTGRHQTQATENDSTTKSPDSKRPKRSSPQLKDPAGTTSQPTRRRSNGRRRKRRRKHQQRQSKSGHWKELKQHYLRTLGNLQRPASFKLDSILESCGKLPAALLQFPVSGECHTLGDVELSQEARRTLSFGGLFVPHNARFVIKNIPRCIEKLRKSILYLSHFGQREEGGTYRVFRVPNTDWEPQPPPGFGGLMEILSMSLYEQLDGVSLKPRHVMDTLQRLASRDDLVIRPADKNLGLVAMTPSIYGQLCRSFLQDMETVSLLEDEVVKQINASLLSILDEADGRQLLDKEVLTYLRQDLKWTALPEFYILPKLHKNPVAARPIVAAHIGPLSYATRWLASVLIPISQRLDSYLQSSRHLTSLLDSVQVPAEASLISMDVSQMYPSLKLNTMMQSFWWAVDKLYSERPKWTQTASQLMALLFNMNYFKWEDQIFKQPGGVKMGVHCGPAIAAIYLAQLEADLVTELEPLLYKRYIDDIFAITSTPQKAQSLVGYLQEHSDLSFTSSVSQTSVDFLDLTIFKGAHMVLGKLDFKTFRKALNLYQYLPVFSSHHPLMVRSWLYAEILRIRNTCSLDGDYEYSLNFFFKAALSRGYGLHILREAVDKIPALESAYYCQNFTLRVRDLPTDGGQCFASCPPDTVTLPYNHDAQLSFRPLQSVLAKLRAVALGHHQDKVKAKQRKNTTMNEGVRLANPNPLPPAVIQVWTTGYSSETLLSKYKSNLAPEKEKKN